MRVEERNREAGKNFSRGVEAADAVASVFASLMGFGKYLVGSLAEVVDYADCGETLHRVDDVVEVFGAVVGEVVEDVDALDSGFSSLLAPEDEIDPLVEMFTHVWTLKSLSVLGYENLWVSFGPWRKLDGVDATAISLSHAEIVPVAVGEEFREVEEFWDQFSNIAHIVLRCRLPGLLDGVE